MDEDLSPAVMSKAVHLATKLGSFASAADSLAETIEVELTTKRVERLAERIGGERVVEREQSLQAWEALPLTVKLAAPPGVRPPASVCVMYDGGRLQRCDLPADAASHWCETKVGVLLELEGRTHAADPCPALPAAFRDLAKMDRLTREIHRLSAEQAAPAGAVFGSQDALPEEGPPPEPLPPGSPEYEPPAVLSRDVAASLADSRRFGRRLAARAWSLGFARADRKAFVGDGQAANWGIWDREFKSQGFVPILDFIHALTYVYAAATAGQTPAAGGQTFLRWLEWVWQGQITRVIAELADRQARCGPPPADAGESDPRRIIAETLTYLANQQSRMDYPEYRKQGLPVTSSHIESAVKQIGRRVKGSEKFWTAAGGEALLQLRGDQLSDTQPLSLHWQHRPRTATGSRAYAKTA